MKKTLEGFEPKNGHVLFASTASAFFSQADYFRIARDSGKNVDVRPKAKSSVYLQTTKFNQPDQTSAQAWTMMFVRKFLRHAASIPNRIPSTQITITFFQP